MSGPVAGLRAAPQPVAWFAKSTESLFVLFCDTQKGSPSASYDLQNPPLASIIVIET